MKIARTSTSPLGTRRVPGAGEDSPLVGLPADGFDDRIAIVGIAGSGKTYAPKGFGALFAGKDFVAIVPLGLQDKSVRSGYRAAFSGIAVYDEVRAATQPVVRATAGAAGGLICSVEALRGRLAAARTAHRQAA
jgi:cysteine sulfinate desulfinase/cysteine desulfurase-like protein